MSNSQTCVVHNCSMRHVLCDMSRLFCETNEYRLYIIKLTDSHCYFHNIAHEFKNTEVF